MYYQLTIEAKSKTDLLKAIQELHDGVPYEIIRPDYAIRVNKRKSVKHTYYYVEWDNFMGSGSVREIRLSRDQYNVLKGGGRIDGLTWIYPYETRFEAECALDRKYQD